MMGGVLVDLVLIKVAEGSDGGFAKVLADIGSGKARPSGEVAIGDGFEPHRGNRVASSCM